jgi:hypothetical protein
MNNANFVKDTENEETTPSKDPTVTENSVSEVNHKNESIIKVGSVIKHKVFGQLIVKEFDDDRFYATDAQGTSRMFLNDERTMKYLQNTSEIEQVPNDRVLSRPIINDSIFMKLGVIKTDNGLKIDGRITLRKCHENITKIGYTWICTNSLTSGMSQEKIKFYNKQMQMGYQVRIYFCINDKITNNDIAFSAQVLNIVASREAIKSPCHASECTEGFGRLKAKTWLKISDLKEETEVTANDMVVINTGNNLKEVISKGQYSFGYIKITNA